jgi:hypothetical protein
MSGDSPAPRAEEPIETASTFLVGGGILTFALFPLAIPMIALLAVAALPLLAVGLALAVAFAPIALGVELVRALRARYRSGGRRVVNRRTNVEHGWMSSYSNG